MRRIAILAALVALWPGLSMAEDTGLKELATGKDSRGWEAVGRINLSDRAFCTGALIAPQVVLTAAHCLFDKTTGERFDPRDIQFLAGWRNGRAAAYRGVRRALPHPNYTYDSRDRLDRVAYDLALIELDQPIRLPSIRPFEMDLNIGAGDEVGVVSYAKDRAEAPSLQEVCSVLGRQPGVLLLSCAVDFGSSGAPIFTMRDGVARVASVVSAKADMMGETVALGISLAEPLAELQDLLRAGDGVRTLARPPVRSLGGTAGGAVSGGGAKFVTP